MDELDIPSKGPSDTAHSVVCVGLAAIPGFGGPLSMAADKFVPTAYDKRVRDWQRAITDAVFRLQDAGIDIDALLDDERFVSAVIKTTRIAMESASNDRFEILRRAVQGSALHSDMPAHEWEQMAFLIERMSHLQATMLATFTLKPRRRYDGELVDSYFLELRNRPDWDDNRGPRFMVEDCLRDASVMTDANAAVCKLAWRELQSLGLTTLDMRDYAYPGGASPSDVRPVLTAEAESLLDFIEEPTPG